jgi:hypothetical protein
MSVKWTVAAGAAIDGSRVSNPISNEVSDLPATPARTNPFCNVVMLGLVSCVAAACSASGQDAGFQYAGMCVLTAAAISGQPSTYGMQAQFGTPATPIPFCQNGQASVGCCLYTGAGPDAGTVAPGPGVSAGMLAANDDVTPIGTLSFDVGTSAYPLLAHANPWGPGDTLTWTGDGEIAGAFHGSVTATSLIHGLNPDPGANPLGVTIHRNTDLSVSWAPDALVSGATMEFDLSVGAPAEFSALIVCKAPDSAGSLVVPMSLLSHLQQNTSGYILFQRRNEATVFGHNVVVSLVAASTAYGLANFPP